MARYATRVWAYLAEPIPLRDFLPIIFVYGFAGAGVVALVQRVWCGWLWP